MNRNTRWAKHYISEDCEIIIEDNEVTNESMTADNIFAMVGRNMQAAGNVFSELKKLELT